MKSESPGTSLIGIGGEEDNDLVVDEVDKDYEGELDEDEAQEEEEDRQRKVMVKLYHASVGDYIKGEDLKLSEILFSPRDAKFHIMDTTLRIACVGSAAPVELWLYAMTYICNHLRQLNGI